MRRQSAGSSRQLRRARHCAGQKRLGHRADGNLCAGALLHPRAIAQTCMIWSDARKVHAMNAVAIDPAELDAYDAWVEQHLDEMVRSHPGKVIAVYNGRLIAVGDSYREVFDAVRKQGLKETPFTLRVPTSDQVNAVFPFRRVRAPSSLTRS